MPVAQEKIDAYKAHLEWMIQELSRRVQKEALLVALKPIASELSKAGSISELNDVRGNWSLTMEVMQGRGFFWGEA